MAGAPKRRRTNGCPPYQHVWPLGALAELICEASKTRSPRIWIDTCVPCNGEPYLSIRDVGQGLSAEELHFRLRVTTPLSTWRGNGAYASPWQAAAMRLGADVVILSKSSTGSLYAALLSRTRLAENGSAALHQPTILLDWSTITASSSRLSDFLAYTPWSSYQEVCDAFASLGEQGTLLIIHSLKRNPEDGELELDLRSDPLDILCVNPNDHSEPPARLTRSLRAYLELLFLRPTFRMILRSIPVRPRRLRSMLWGPADFSYTPRARSDLGVIGRDPGRAAIRLGFDSKANPSEFGMLLYCQGRLIRPYLKVGLQAQVQSGVKVVGIVEAEFVTPTRNMQNFERDKYYTGLMFSLDRSLKIYWTRYGSMAKAYEAHSKDPVPRWATCDDCGKWRLVSKHCPTDPDDTTRCPRWVCAMNVGGTVTCGADDDEDMQIITIGKRILASSRLGPDFATPQKRFRGDLRDDGFERDDFMRFDNTSMQRYARDATSNSMPLARSSTQSIDVFHNAYIHSNGDGANTPYFAEAERHAVQALNPSSNFTTIQSPSQIQTTELQIDLEGPMPELFPSGLLELDTDDFKNNGRRGSSNMVRERDNTRRIVSPNVLPGSSSPRRNARSPVRRKSLSPDISPRELTPDGSGVLQSATGKCSTNASTELYPRDDSIPDMPNVEHKRSALRSDQEGRSEGIEIGPKAGHRNISDLEPIKSSSSVSREGHSKLKSVVEHQSAKPPLATSNDASLFHKSVINGNGLETSWRKAAMGTSAQLSSAETQTVGASNSIQKELLITTERNPTREGRTPYPPGTNHKSLGIYETNSCETPRDNHKAPAKSQENKQYMANHSAGNNLAKAKPLTDFDVATPFGKEGLHEDRTVQEQPGAEGRPVSIPNNVILAPNGLNGTDAGKPPSHPTPPTNPIKSPPQPDSQTGKTSATMSTALALKQDHEEKMNCGAPEHNTPDRTSKDHCENALLSKRQAHSSVAGPTDKGPEADQKVHANAISNSNTGSQKEGEKRDEQALERRPEANQSGQASEPLLSTNPTKSKDNCLSEDNLPPDSHKAVANRTAELQNNHRQDATPKRRRCAIPDETIDLTPRKRPKGNDSLQPDLIVAISPRNGRSPGCLLGRTRPEALHDPLQGEPLEGIQVPKNLFELGSNAIDPKVPRGQQSVFLGEEDAQLDYAWQLQDPMQLDQVLSSPLQNVQPPNVPSNNTPFKETPYVHNGGTEHERGNSARVEDGNIGASQAVATHIAASTARAVLSGTGRLADQHETAGTEIGNKMLSEIALSAAVAAATAAITATVTRRRGAGNMSDNEPQSQERLHLDAEQPSTQNTAQPNTEDIYKSKLQELVCLLAPGAADGGFVSWVNNVESLNMTVLAREIEERQEQKQKEKAERDLHEEMDSLRASQQIACESLQSIRRLLRIFLEKAVGISQNDDQDEPVESQFEEYLRLLEVLPQSK